MTKVRLAAKGDAAHIARLMQQGQRHGELDITIYGRQGIVRFLQAQMSLPFHARDTQYVVALREDVIAGFGEFKLEATNVFLNYICTAPEMRGSGIARCLLCEGMRLVRRPRHSTIGLDVFIDNADARQWYQRMGFNAKSRSAWWRIPLTTMEGDETGRISGYGQALACHAVYGFSSFNLATSKTTYGIGQLGERWFKTTDPGVLSDQEALASLAIVDSRRDLLGLFPVDFSCEHINDAERLHVADRLSMDMDSLLRRLADRRSIE